MAAMRAARGHFVQQQWGKQGDLQYLGFGPGHSHGKIACRHCPQQRRRGQHLKQRAAGNPA